MDEDCKEVEMTIEVIKKMLEDAWISSGLKELAGESERKKPREIASNAINVAIAITEKRYCELGTFRVVRCPNVIQEKTKIGKTGTVTGISESKPAMPASVVAEESNDTEKINRKAAK